MALAVPVAANQPSNRGPAEISDSLQAALAEGAGSVDVLVSTADSDYDAVIAAIEDVGGTVYQTFKYANGLAATLPRTSIADIAALGDVTNIGLDSLREVPGHASFTGGEPTRAAAETLDAALREGAAFVINESAVGFSLSAEDIAADPATYWGFTPDSMDAAAVWSQGILGQDSIIAVIDTGVYEDHFMLNGRVIGGVDISTDVGTANEGATRVDNHFHGTHVAGIAAGLGAVCEGGLFSFLADSIEYHSGTLLPTDPGCGGGRVIPLIGMAPSAEVYAIKVFDHEGGSATESTIIAGIEHAIDLKVNEVHDIDVINMSLGGWTGYDGRDLEDQVVDAATAAGITVVSAASNDGPYSMTINSPGTANSSITAGAIAHPVNTKVFWDFNFGILTIGDLLYVDSDPQVIYFSSRGPTADGRDKPTASAIGVFVLSASTGSPTALAFASGTSMATPGLAGVAALLNTYGELTHGEGGVSPYDIKQAIVAGSHPVPDFDALDQGAGLIDAGDALTALQADSNLGQAHPSLPQGHSVQIAEPKGVDLNLSKKNTVVEFDVTLEPGMSNHYTFELPERTESVTVDISDVDLGVDPILFNSFEVYIQGGGKAGAFFSGLTYVDTTNVWGDATFVIEDLSTTIPDPTFVFGVNTADLPLMPGDWKIVIENDWTSFDTLSGTVSIELEVAGNASDVPDEVHAAALQDLTETDFFEVGFGPNGVELDLSWIRDYTRYSTSDMDLIVAWFDTDDNLHFDFSGASLSSPEKVVIDANNIDQVFVLVSAFNTYGQVEQWTLEVRYRD